MLKSFSVFAAILILCAATAADAADTITLAGDEGSKSGTISEVSKTEVTILIGPAKKPEKYPANKIVDVRWDGEPPRLNFGRNDENGGRLSDALAKYKEALDSNPSNPLLKTDLEFLMARVTAKLALADPAQLDAAIKQLDGFLKANSDNFRYYSGVRLLGDLYLAKQDYASAQTAYTQLGSAPWNDSKMASRNALANLQLQQGDVAGALSNYDAVVAMTASTPGEFSRRYEAMLGKATCLQKQNQHEQAISTLQTVTDEAAATDTAVLARAYVRKGDSLSAIGKTKEAILAYLHVDVLFPQETALHAESLYRLWQLWGQAGYSDRVAETAAKLDQQYPNSEWTKKLSGS